MRKLILLCAALFVSTFAFAQFEKGDIQLGGNITWNKVEQGAQENTFVNVLPRAGYFVSNNVSLGLAVGFSNREFNTFDIGSGNLVETSQDQFLIGAYARFHKSVAERFYLYLQPAFTIGSGDREVGDATVGDVNSFNIAISPGLTYFLSPKFALEMSFDAFSYNKLEIDAGVNSEETESYGIDLDLSNVTLGINFYIK